MTRVVVLGAAAAILGGCGGEGKITIELQEVNESGISGRIELTPVGDDATRVAVAAVDGGNITGVRIMGEGSCPGLNDLYAVRSPSGVLHVRFEELRDWLEDEQLFAEFMRSGRSVACGAT